MMKKIITAKFANLFLIAIISVFTFTMFNGCDENNPLNPTVTSRLQLTHASPDAPNIDVYIGSSKIASNLAYLSTLSYTSITGDAVSRIIVNAANSSTILIDTAVYFLRDRSFSVFVFDSLQKIQPLILTDSSSSPGSINASLRFINLSPNSPSLDVGAVSKIQPWFPFYSFPKASPYRPIVGGIYTVYANLAGTSTTLVTVPDVNLPARGIFTIIANGYVGGTGAKAFGFTLIPNN
ncbi:MAG: DUF4397 domain-containing protein [bacterium]